MQKLNNRPSNKLTHNPNAKRNFRTKKHALPFEMEQKEWKGKEGDRRSVCCTCGLLLATACPSVPDNAQPRQMIVGGLCGQKDGGHHTIDPSASPSIELAWEGEKKPMLSSKSLLLLFFIQS